MNSSVIYYPELGYEIKSLGFDNWRDLINFISKANNGIHYSRKYDTINRINNWINSFQEDFAYKNAIIFTMSDDKDAKYSLVNIICILDLSKDNLIKLLKLKSFI